LPSVFAFADRLEARAAPVASDPEPGIPLLVAASARFGELEMPFERAVTDLKLAEALIATGPDGGSTRVVHVDLRCGLTED
jgi:hypothetical protein